MSSQTQFVSKETRILLGFRKHLELTVLRSTFSKLEQNDLFSSLSDLVMFICAQMCSKMCPLTICVRCIAMLCLWMTKITNAKCLTVERYVNLGRSRQEWLLALILRSDHSIIRRIEPSISVARWLSPQGSCQICRMTVCLTWSPHYGLASDLWGCRRNSFPSWCKSSGHEGHV